MSTINTHKLIQAISNNTEVPVDTTKLVVESLLSEIEYNLFQWKKVTLTGYFNINTRKVKWQMKYNPKFKQSFPMKFNRSITSTISPYFQNRIRLFDKHNTYEKSN